MGTTSEWMQALEFGGIFAAAMILLDAIRDRKGATGLPNLFATAMSSFAVGMLWAFGWRVFRGGIALLFWGILLAGFGVALAVRRARFKSGLNSFNPQTPRQSKPPITGF
jgi:hypothetical protein